MEISGFYRFKKNFRLERMNLSLHFCDVREEKGISVCRPLGLEWQAAEPTRQKEETSSDQIEAFVQVGGVSNWIK